MRKPRNFSWVTENLACSAMPTSREEVEYLAKVGVRAMVSLDADLPREVVQAIRELGIEHYIEEVEDLRAPSLEQMERIVRTIEEHASRGEKVVVHCYAGCGRTGTILAAYLVYTGADPREAIDYVRSLRPCSIETYPQELAVEYFAKYLESQRERS